MDQPRPEDVCDEGGTHVFSMPDKGSSGWSSEGAAAVSPVGMMGGDDRPDEPTCRKCGLNPSEASAIAQAKSAEAQGLRTSKGTNYFTTSQMRINAPANPSDPSSTQYPPLPPPPHSASPNPSSRRPSPKPSPAGTPVPGSPAPPYLAQGQPVAQGGQEQNPVGKWLSTLPPSEPMDKIVS
ncbi:hypothetical protein JCM8547_009353 [Rhodosporidiobolus lusitaniae]